jgi:hypothetical protein
VTAGSTVLATGTVVDASGKPVARQRIALQASTGTGWVTVASAASDRAGQVSLYSPAIAENTRLRLKLTNRHLLRPLLSSVARVSETPSLIVSFSGGALHISTVGAQPGDAVRIGVVRDGALTQLGTAVLTDTSATFTVEQTPVKQRFVLVLPRTPQHLGARSSIVVPGSVAR